MFFELFPSVNFWTSIFLYILVDLYFVDYEVVLSLTTFLLFVNHVCHLLRNPVFIFRAGPEIESCWN